MSLARVEPRRTHGELLFPALQVCQARLHVCVPAGRRRLLIREVVRRRSLERGGIVLFVRVRVKPCLNCRVCERVLHVHKRSQHIASPPRRRSPASSSFALSRPSAERATHRVERLRLRIREWVRHRCLTCYYVLGAMAVFGPSARRRRCQLGGIGKGNVRICIRPLLVRAISALGFEKALAPFRGAAYTILVYSYRVQST